MIILITGASYTGKTFLSHLMIEKYKYPCLSIDHLKMGLIRSSTVELTPYDDEALAVYLWPIVREIIKTAIENHQNLIVEGCYVPFYWRKSFDERYLLSIRYICLVMSETYINDNFGKIKEHGSDMELRKDDEVCSMDKLKAENLRYIEGCRKYGEQFTLIEKNYEQTLKSLLT